MSTPTATAPTPAPAAGRAAAPPDHRGSPIPPFRMIKTRFMELRKRRGLMIALAVVNIGIPTLFLVIRLIAHAADPKAYGPAGGYSIYTALVAGVMYIFGFIVAATVGCTAGSVDLSEGMFRHEVVTGRSRLAIYLARIPAGLAIVVPMVAAGFVIVCAVCAFAAPTQLNYDGVIVPSGLSRAGLENWAAAHPDRVMCDFSYRGPGLPNLPCGPNGRVVTRIAPGSANGTANTPAPPTHGQVQAAARKVAAENYAGYSSTFLSPPIGLMVRSGLWIELEAILGFTIGLGLSSLIGQRTISVVLMIVLELILTPIFSRTGIPHLINLQRGVVGLAMAHIEPSGLPLALGGGNGPGGSAPLLVPESRGVAVCVIIAWLVVWSVLGAWRMKTRDA